MLMSECVPSLVSALLQPRTNRLERIDISNNYIYDKEAVTLVNAFNEMPGMCYLLELCLARNKIGRLGCTAICNLLNNSTSSIQHLDIQRNDDSCIDILIGACKSKRSTVKVLLLGNQSFVTTRGWLAFTAFLTHPHCILGSVSLTGGIGDVGSESPVIALSNHKTLKHVDIGK